MHLSFINEFKAITFYCFWRHCSHILLLRPTYKMWTIYDWILDSNIKTLQLARSKWMKNQMLKRNIKYFLRYLNTNANSYSLANIRYRSMTFSLNHCYEEYGVPKCLWSISYRIIRNNYLFSFVLLLCFWKILLMISSNLGYLLKLWFPNEKLDWLH